MYTELDYQEIKCNQCHKKLKICQIERKIINNSLEFKGIDYYCPQCDLKYYIFIFIEIERDDKN